ncbi:MAG: peptidoglycan-binding domain-containing protein [Patescibacteria group bacterium]
MIKSLKLNFVLGIVAIVIIAVFFILVFVAKTVSAEGNICNITRVLKLRSRGEDVKCLQRALKVKVTGFFGTNTRKAVKNFQANNELEVTGIFDFDTRDVLFEGEDLSSVTTQSTYNATVLRSINGIVAIIHNTRGLSELIYDRNLRSYASLCSNGLINTLAHHDLPGIVKDIIAYQGVVDQLNAGIICVAKKEKYALEVTFKKKFTTTGSLSDPYSSGKSSYCIDSSGDTVYGPKYKINKDNFECKIY